MEFVSEAKRTETKFISKVYGYVALGLLLTAFIAFVVGALFANAFNTQDAEAVTEKYLYLLVGSGIALLVDTIVMRVTLARNNHSGWIPYLIYCSLFGIFLSTFVTIGIPFYLFGEAFAISGLVFLVLFLVGYFSPINLNVVGSIALSFLFGAFLIGLVFLILSLINPNLYTVYDILTAGAILIYMLLMVAVDAYNIKRYSQSGSDNDNLVLHCAVNLYTDFLYIFIRVLYFVLRVWARSKN